MKVSKSLAKSVWIRSQRLDVVNPFGVSASAVEKAIRHLGYVQIDTINVIERCHHHILYNRIPNYRRSDLKKAQSEDKTIFEYWTHALSYVPVTDFKYFVPQMRAVKTGSGYWMGKVQRSDFQKVRKLLDSGPIAIRDIKDDQLRDKEHDWDSKKPSKRALEFGFHKGEFVVCRREGIAKVYDLTLRHFDWQRVPEPVSQREFFDYIVSRALRSQGIVSLDSICHLRPKWKPEVEKELDRRVSKNALVPVHLEGSNIRHWLEPENLDQEENVADRVHILSPFDPLIIQRKRLKLFFDYEHVFEAYVPSHKRKFGYFSLPVLCDNTIIALLDLKADRLNRKLLVQNWITLRKGSSKRDKAGIEAALHQFEKFQLAVD